MPRVVPGASPAASSQQPERDGQELFEGEHARRRPSPPSRRCCSRSSAGRRRRRRRRTASAVRAGPAPSPRSGRRPRANVSRLDSSRASTRAARSNGRPRASALMAEASSRNSADDRPVGRVFEQLGAPPEVRHVVAPEGEARRPDPGLQVDPRRPRGSRGFARSFRARRRPRPGPSSLANHPTTPESRTTHAGTGAPTGAVRRPPLRAGKNNMAGPCSPKVSRGACPHVAGNIRRTSRPRSGNHAPRRRRRTASIGPPLTCTGGRALSLNHRPGVDKGKSNRVTVPRSDTVVTGRPRADSNRGGFRM